MNYNTSQDSTPQQFINNTAPAAALLASAQGQMIDRIPPARFAKIEGMINDALNQALFYYLQMQAYCQINKPDTAETLNDCLDVIRQRLNQATHIYTSLPVNHGLTAFVNGPEPDENAGDEPGELLGYWRISRERVAAIKQLYQAMYGYVPGEYGLSLPNIK